MVVYPIDTLGKSVSTNRIEPMLLASPTLKAYTTKMNPR